MGYIYCIYFKDTPVYVGQTIKQVNERWKEHLQASKRNEKLKNYNIHNYMNDNGLSNFSIKEIEKTDKLNEREQYWIKKMKTHISENGYNLTYGGQTAADSLKKKCYQYNLNGDYIKEFPSIEEASRSVEGSHSNIIKVLNQELNTAYGFRWSLSKMEKLPPLSTTYTGASKRVYQYDLNDNLLNIFESTKEAARFLNKSQGNISLAANGHRKTAYGFKWSYDYIMKLAGY